jgi:hypothetical protein
MPVPLDEFPIHQAPISMAHPATSDRHFYDRSYFNAHDRTGEIFLISGLGVYPNLGVIDAYATVRTGDSQWAVRFSDALGDDRMRQQVGAYRIEVLEPLQRIRLVCDGDEHGLGFDLTWEGSFPAVEEPRHVSYMGSKLLLDACRFAQVGTWDGALRVAGREVAVSSSHWVGTRDRSWGIRPVGEPEPPGRAAAEPNEGFWWLYVPLRFDDYAIIVIVQEQPDGHRVMSEASRVWPDGRREQLGWPEIDITYRSGSRHPERATLQLSDRGKPVTIDIETLGFIAIHVGAGYGGDPDWGHGQWRGRNWAEGAVYDLNDPAVAGRIPFGVIDHVARATCDGAEGFGLFEHGTIGRHDPTGFADYTSVAR